MRRKLLDRSQGVKKYGVSTFFGTQMQRYYDSSSIPSDFFRLFEPVKPQKHRRLNPAYDPDFDIYLDTLMDYPTIIQGKLGGRWEQYNRMVAVQVAACTPFDCWHCYLDEELKRGKLCTFVTAAQVVDSFIEQRDRDKQQGLEDNVLRITGGEPFLLPDLILDCLTEIKSRGLDKEIFLWTETNLSPFLKRTGSQRTLVEEWLAEEGRSLGELAQHKNFCVHPCLHGISSENMAWIAKTVDTECFDGLLEGLHVLIENGIDIYPTFGSNMSPPESVPEIFGKLVSIHRNLPLRFALINYELNYEQVLLRTKANIDRYSKVYNKDLIITLWDELIRKEYSNEHGSTVGYAKIPRHLVPLKTDNTLFLFKRPYTPEYRRRILTILGLPSGLTYEVPYREKYLSANVREAAVNNPSLFVGKKAMSFCVDARNDQNHLALYPLRECIIRKVWKPDGSDFVHFLFEVRGYPVAEPAECTAELLNKYGKEGLPPQRDDAYVMSGEKIDSITTGDFCETNWEKIVKQLAEVPELREHAFYQLLSVSDQQGKAVEAEDADSYKRMKFNGGKKYRARLAVRLPHHYESGGRYSTKMSIILAKGLENIGDSEVEIRTKYETRDYFEFICRRVNQSSKFTVQDAEDPFSAPKFEIPVMITSLPKWVKPTVAIVLLATASALGAIGEPWYAILTAAGTGLLYYGAIHILLR